MKERRKKFLINKAMQFRYMAYFSSTLILVSIIVLISLYFGIWGGILDAFSDKEIREQLLIASRITEYEEARLASKREEGVSVLALFKQAEKLSQRQREVFKDILNQTNKKLIQKLLFLIVLIGWGSIYLSHKIAGPLYRFEMSLRALDRGDFRSRIHLRQRDEAQFLAKKLNYTIENLDFTFSRIKHIIAANRDNPEKMVAKLDEILVKYKTSIDEQRP